MNPNIRVIQNYVGVTDSAWNNPGKGKEIALAQISKGADVISITEPFATQSNDQNFALKWKSPGDVAPWYQPSLLAANSNVVQSKAAAVEKFVEVSVVTGREINAYNGVWTDDFLKTAHKWAGIDADTVRAVGQAPYYDPNGQISLDAARLLAFQLPE